MKSVTFRWARPVAALAALAVISSCGLPQVGPNKRQIYAGSVQREGDAFVIAVNDRVTRAIAVARVPAIRAVGAAQDVDPEERSVGPRPLVRHPAGGRWRHTVSSLPRSFVAACS